MNAPRSQPESRKVPVLVPDPNSASGHRVEWASIEVDGDLAKILDSCAIEASPLADDRMMLDGILIKHLKERNATLQARVEELTKALEEIAELGDVRADEAAMIARRALAVPLEGRGGAT